MDELCLREHRPQERDAYRVARRLLEHELPGRMLQRKPRSDPAAQRFGRMLRRQTVAAVGAMAGGAPQLLLGLKRVAHARMCGE